MSTDTAQVDVTQVRKDAAEKERLRIGQLFLKNSGSMISDYKNTIKHTGGLLTQSMVFAYSKALNDALKLLTKGSEDEKSI